MDKGILGTLQLAAALVFAVPVGLMGLDFLVSGRTLLGAGFLAFAALMVAVEEYVTTPKDLPGEAAGKVVESVVGAPEDEE